MESLLPSSPLTRFDAVMWFLRVHLWLSLVALVVSSLSSLVYFFTPINLPYLWLQLVGLALVPVLILLFFPAVLASNALGSTSRQPVASLSDLKSLLGRCFGLMLFVSSLGPIVLYFGALFYALATGTPASFLGTSIVRSMGLTQIIGPTISFFLGFALAFGPNIRDSFRAR